MIFLENFYRVVGTVVAERATEELKTINRKLDQIMATQAELAAKLTAIGDELDKAQAEIVTAIQALKDALSAAGATSPEVDAAVARLEGSAKALDDLNPDA